MILRPEDPAQLCMTCRSDIVSDEPILGVINEVVDKLDLTELYARYSESGRPFYDPAMMLKVLFFGYSAGITASRPIARSICYDLRFQYFTVQLRPDFRTINRFRLSNLDLLGGYFAELVSMCESAGLLDVSVLAIDGTKLHASSSGHRTLHKDELSQACADMLTRDASVEEEGVRDDDNDDTESSPPPVEKLIPVRKVTDPDARFMRTSAGVLSSSYNGQIAVDRNQVVVAASVTTAPDDTGQLIPLVEQSQAHLSDPIGNVLVDGGYYSGRNLKYAKSSGIELYVPVPKQGRVPDDRFERDAFVYDAMTDSYHCPAGEELRYSTTRQRNDIKTRVYRASRKSCRECRFHTQCTRRPCRDLSISEVAELEQQMRSKLASGPGRAMYRQRQHMVETVFGNLKRNLGFRQFSMRTQAKVQGEFLLMCIAHNLKKLATYRRTFGRAVSAAVRDSMWTIKRLFFHHQVTLRGFSGDSCQLSFAKLAFTN